MNIEVKRSIEIDNLLPVLKLESESGQSTLVTIDRELLKDAVQVIEVLVKKNKQLRDINKNLNEKLERRNATISDLSNQVGELNTLMFEMQIPEGKCDCGNKCCCEEDSDEDKEPTVKDVLNELEVVNELVAVARLIGIL